MKHILFSKIFPISVILIFIVLSIFSTWKESLTYDEIVNLQEGKNAWVHRTFDIEPYHPPLAKDLQAAPIVGVENGLHIHLNLVEEKVLGRVVVILFGIILLSAVFLVTKKYFGDIQACIALTLLAFEPNTLAFAHIINTDFLVVAMIFICYVLFVQLVQKPSRRLFLIFSVVLGLGFASKMSFDSFFPLSALAALLYLKQFTIFSWIWQKKYLIALTVGIVLLVVWSTYFFHFGVVIKERADANRVSEKILTYAKVHHNQLLYSAVMMGKTAKIPLGDYIALYKNVALAKAAPNCFFMGVFYPKCSWYFMPVTFALKTPLPLLLLFLISVWLIIKEKKRKEDILFLIPSLVILAQAATSGAFPLNRYMLPVYPFMAITAAKSIRLSKKSMLAVLFVVVLLFWQAFQTSQLFPHFLSFTNELAGPKTQQYLHFQDANIDWGQSLPDIKTYIETHPVKTLSFSYFGRDDGDLYGLLSDKPYGSYKAGEICEFHTIHNRPKGDNITIISISNWWQCGYYKMPQFKNPKSQISDSFLVF